MKKRVTIFLTFGAIVSACGGSSPEGASRVDNRPELVAETTITEPTPVAETDFDALYRELDAIRQESYAENDPAKLATVSGDKQSVSDLRRQVDTGQKTIQSDDYSYTVDEVAIFHIADEDRVELRVVDSIVGETIGLDADGNEISRSSREAPTQTFVVLLERVDADEWQIQYDLEVPNEFPASSDAFTEQNTFAAADQTVSFKTVDAGDSQCYSLGFESEPISPTCNASSNTDGFLRTEFQILGDNEYEAIIGITLRAADEFLLEVDDDPVEFFGDTNSYAIKVAEFGTTQQALLSSGTDSDTFEISPVRDQTVQIQEGTYVPDESEVELQGSAPPSEEPTIESAPVEPVPRATEPGGPTIEIGADDEITLGIGG